MHRCSKLLTLVLAIWVLLSIPVEGLAHTNDSAHHLEYSINYVETTSYELVTGISATDLRFIPEECCLPRITAPAKSFSSRKELVTDQIYNEPHSAAVDSLSTLRIPLPRFNLPDLWLAELREPAALNYPPLFLVTQRFRD